MGLTDPNILVDHIDHNGLNNQKSNLRVVSSSQNKKNQTLLCNNKFHFNGITLETKGDYQRVRVRWSEGTPEWKYNGWRCKSRTKSFNVNSYNRDYNKILKDAILFRIAKMKENGYLLDERSTTIERILLEEENPDIEKLLNINFKEVFE